MWRRVAIRLYLIGGKMVERELELCPFCGCAAHIWEDGRFSIKPYYFPKWYIECNGCHIRTPITYIEDAVGRWNKRQ